MCDFANWIVPFILGGGTGAILVLVFFITELKRARRSVLEEYNLSKKSELDDLI
jgi:hypothetical protein